MRLYILLESCNPSVIGPALHPIHFKISVLNYCEDSQAVLSSEEFQAKTLHEMDVVEIFIEKAEERTTQPQEITLELLRTCRTRKYMLQ
jgi:hypothetical protein